MTTDHYELLGVAPSAGHAEIRAAYRRLMREHHPDLCPGDPGAEEMSRRLTAAWAVLSRPTARSAYDRTRSAGRAGTEPQRPPDDPGAHRSSRPPAYSAVGNEYRRAFHLASVKLAMVVFAVGVLLLTALSR